MFMHVFFTGMLLATGHSEVGEMQACCTSPLFSQTLLNWPVEADFHLRWVFVVFINQSECLLGLRRVCF